MTPTKIFGILALLFFLNASGSLAATCESGKNSAAGKYVQCLSKAWSKLALTSNSFAFNQAVAKCDDKLERKWTALESANDGTCSTGDLVVMRSYLKAKAEAVSQAVQTGASLISIRADMSHTDLSGVDLSGRDLSGMNFTGANLASANLTTADLTGANLSEVVMNFADLSGATMAGAIVTHLTAEILDNCPAVLPSGWVCLSNKTLIGATARLVLQDLSFGVDLSNLDLHGLELAFVDLTNANFTNTNLTGTQWTNVVCPDGTSSFANMPESCCANMNGNLPASCTP